MKINLRNLVGLVLLASLLTYPMFAAEKPEGPNGKNTQLNKTGQTKNAAILNINNFTYWLQANGQGANPPDQSFNGDQFPRGTTHPIFADGFLWGGKCYLDAARTQPAPVQLIRVGGNTYNVGNQAGWISGSGASAVAVNPADPRARVYRVRRDYTAMAIDELKQDAAENNQTLVSSVTDADVAALVAQYTTDWDQWPVDLGAPYIERNGVPGYQKPPPFGPNFTVDSLIAGNFDEPGVAGGDPKSPANQVVWTVFNDLNRGNMLGFEGSEPMGLEGQITLWGYKRSDALGNLFFKRIKIINKGGAVVNSGTGAVGSLYIDSMFVAQWSDEDLGNAGDDLAGCDSLLSVAFVWNGNAIDADYARFKLPPPCIGYDFFAGPVKQTVPTDTAIFDLKQKPGYKNLAMSSFCWFAAGNPIASDPPFSYEGALQWWKLLRGYRPNPSTAPDLFYPGPPGDPPTKFPLGGDPFKGTGSLDGLGLTYSSQPGDRRTVSNTGPFLLQPGDTQEVTMGVVCGLGSDRKSSVAVMKFNDQFAQSAYDALFRVPRAPKSPTITIGELNQQIVLEWGSDVQTVKDIENTVSQPGGYTFEGYNVYQLPSRSSSLSAAKRILTYDLTSDPTTVLDQQFDPISGQILTLPVEFGTNSGIYRYFVFSRDYVRDIANLNNGQEYYLAVTAYTIKTVAGYTGPSALESNPIVITVRPKVPFGKVYASAIGDTLPVTHTAGVSDGVIRPIVVNPAGTTGHTYQITFDSTGGSMKWNVRDVTSNPPRNILVGQTNQDGSALEKYNIIEGGIYLKVEGPAPGTKSWSIPGGARRFSPVNGFAGLGLEGFSSAGDPTAYDPSSGTIGAAGHFAFGGIGTTLTDPDYHSVLLQLAAVPDTALWNPRVAPTDVNFSKAYRWLRNSSAVPADPNFVPWILTTGSGYQYQEFSYGVPFSAWDIDVNPPARLMVGHFENNVVNGRVDGRYWPYNASEAVDNTVAREFAFIFKKPYSTTDDATMHVNLSGNSSLPMMWVMVCSRRNALPWATGDQFQINASHVNFVTDVFSFTEPPPSAGTDLEKTSVSKIGVFPNPYYAFNPAEINRFVRFVTFNNLPAKATVRIFNLAGQLVRTLDKNDNSQFLKWDLNNKFNFPVASGIYIAYLELTLSDGSVSTKVLKLAIIQEQEVPDVF